MEKEFWLMAFAVALGFVIGFLCLDRPLVVIETPDRIEIEVNVPWEMAAEHVTLIQPRPDPEK